ncbi:hypothetical protein SprV_0100299700 [Sparganum proliferum]
MVPRRGGAVCTSRRCELRHLAAWAESVITRRQIDVSVDRVGVRHPSLQQFSPCLVASSRQYPRAGEVELMAFLQRHRTHPKEEAGHPAATQFTVENDSPNSLHRLHQRPVLSVRVTASALERSQRRTGRRPSLPSEYSQPHCVSVVSETSGRPDCKPKSQMLTQKQPQCRQQLKTPDLNSPSRLPASCDSQPTVSNAKCTGSPLRHDRQHWQSPSLTLVEWLSSADLDSEILRLNSVSDRQRYHQLLKEESLGDRKPSELLRGMRSLLGDMRVDDKFVKDMFLERLPADVQTILASGSQDLTVSQLAEMADRMIEVQRFQSPSVAQITTSSSTVNEMIMKQVSAMADEMASLKLPARLPVAYAAVVVPVRDLGLPILVAETGKPVSQRIDETVFSGSSGSGRTFYVCDTATRRRFLVDTGAQISVVPSTAADRRFPSSGLHLQAANGSPIPTFGSLSLILNIGFRRSFTWIFVIADVPHAILGSDFLPSSISLLTAGVPVSSTAQPVCLFVD